MVYGLRGVGSSAVELENGKLVRRSCPPFPADCRGCSLLDLVCEELEYPCQGIRDQCSRSVECEECNQLAECLTDRPCCWKCKHLTECLENAKEGGAEDFVKHMFGCNWDEFVEAVKML